MSTCCHDSYGRQVGADRETGAELGGRGKPRGRLGRARALYQNLPKRRVAWLLLKDTVNSCMQYRVIGLAAEAAFFSLLSLPPLLLGLLGLLGYFDQWLIDVETIRHNIIDASDTVMTAKGVDEIVRPLLDDVTRGGRADLISFGFALALWSGSRAVNVFIDTITIMYGLEGHRGIVKTRLLAFGLYLVALVMGVVALPLMVAGPDAVVTLLPWSETAVRVLYWPVVVVLSVAFLTTLYHAAVPVRSPWREDLPGALVALGMWLLGSVLLRLYLVNAVEGPTIYGSLAAPVAVLLWFGVSAFAVLVGAAVNAAFDRVWPSVATATGRAETARAREEAAARLVAAASAERQARLRGLDGDASAEERAREPEPEWAEEEEEAAEESRRAAAKGRPAQPPERKGPAEWDDPADRVDGDRHEVK
ncbi:membrane protein [Streptomyces sp. CNQ-509]|uniref:YihY/virulence factor BrkB family protein n=1 Tax=unclassified Streptomyces TaxID=2593676 RepID=UPI00062DE958|nr:YihY/virulence factor BrkB family protein [Streptomyces sp. CNQ-509]AKH85469.1 membrane protein [Streptomyces sp. CNQ-509]